MTARTRRSEADQKPYHRRYALAQAHASIFRLLLRPFLLGRKPTVDRAEWKEELGAMWTRALKSAFLF